MTDELSIPKIARFHVEQDLIETLLTVDDVIGIEDGNVRTMKRVLAHFAVNEDGTRIDYDVAFKLVGKLTIRQLKETAQALIGKAEDDLVPKESSGG